MKLNWNRILRTTLQGACGAAVSLITAISANWSKDSIIASLIIFGTTVATSFFMNIEKEVETEE